MFRNKTDLFCTRLCNQKYFLLQKKLSMRWSFLGERGLIKQLQDNLELYNCALPSRIRARLNRKRLSIGPQDRLQPPAASKAAHNRIDLAEGQRPNGQLLCWPAYGLRELGQMVESHTVAVGQIGATTTTTTTTQPSQLEDSSFCSHKCNYLCNFSKYNGDYVISFVSLAITMAIM